MIETLIKLDKRLYKNAKHHILTSSEIDEICDVIANGTPLPKGHGRLIDENTIEIPFDICDGEEAFDYVVNAPTVLEAEGM